MRIDDDVIARIANVSAAFTRLQGRIWDQNGVNQGCVLAPTLFSIMFSVMLLDDFQDDDNGIPIRYRPDGKLFNLRRLQAKFKVQTKLLDEFLSPDDIKKDIPTEEKMQKCMDQV